MILRRAIIIFTIVVIIVLGFVGFTSMKTSTIVVVLDGNYSLTDTKVTIDDRQVYPSGQGAKTYRTKVSTGDHAIEVTSPGYETFAKNLSLGLMSEETLNVSLKEIAPASVADTLIHDSSDATVLNAQYFGDKDWVVYFVGSSTAGNEGSIVVSRYFASDKKWYIVDEGTDIDTTADVYAEAPDDLINYLRNY